VIWGGDWNHALEGTDHVGSREGRDHITGVLDTLGLPVSTAHLDARGGERSIDHIAFPRSGSSSVPSRSLRSTGQAALRPRRVVVELKA